jgi:hypothetical protein
MTEFVMVVLALIPPDVLPSATPSPSAFSPRQGPGRGAYLLGGFIGLGILLLAMVLLRRPKRVDRRTLDQ